MCCFVMYSYVTLLQGFDASNKESGIFGKSTVSREQSPFAHCSKKSDDLHAAPSATQLSQLPGNISSNRDPGNVNSNRDPGNVSSNRGGKSKAKSSKQNNLEADLTVSDCDQVTTKAKRKYNRSKKEKAEATKKKLTDADRITFPWLFTYA